MSTASGASRVADGHHLTQPKYRPDIDGLRGLAVLAVMGYHAFPRLVRGGFVGVDVFFVISGFLISSILFKNLENNSFSYTEFYSRRIKRIFPALIVILIPCLFLGWFLLPTEYSQLGKHVAAGAGFVSNFAFWKEAGYFTTSAESKPLLHLWSLGIEEQFYIFWPLLLGVCSRRRLNFLSVTLLVALASFATNLYLVESNPVAAFYSPIPRFWELMLGGLLAYLTLHGQRRLPQNASWLSIGGLLLIAAGIVFTSNETPFPGWRALLPTVGAFLAIAAGPGSAVNRKVFANRTLVWIGLISYPLYLWHWPILFVVRRLFLPGRKGLAAAAVILGAMAFSILLSWLTYKLVETPIRFGSLKNRAVGPLAATMALLIVAGISVHRTDGFARRFSPPMVAILEVDYQRVGVDSYREGTCFLRREQSASSFANCTAHAAVPRAPSIVLWGDSHAAHLYPGLQDAIGRTTELTQFTAASCPPIMGYTSKGWRHCKEINDYVMAYCVKEHPDRVILAAAWTHYDWKTLESTIQQLKQAGVRQIDLVGPVPLWTDRLPSVLFKYSVQHPEESSVPKRMSFGLLPNLEQLDRSMREFAERQGITYLSPYQILCDAEGCLTMVGETPDSVLMWDDSHLTVAGSRFVVSHSGYDAVPER